MDASVTQRWVKGRASYRVAGEPISVADYDVVELAKKGGPARDFVVAHHYSGTVPAARRQFGLYHRRDGLVGAAIFSVPARVEVLAGIPIQRWLLLQHCLDLGRFVLADDVPANGETLFLGECFRRLAREGFAGVVSFADPVRRLRRDGSEVMPGHIGTIYRAHNAVYTGRSKARVHQLLPDGTILSPRLIQKIRAQEVGWKYGVDALVRFGAQEPAGGERLEDWLRAQLPAVATRFPHSGCLRYVWAFHRLIKRRMGNGLRYPTWAELGLAAPTPRRLAAA